MPKKNRFLSPDPKRTIAKLTSGELVCSKHSFERGGVWWEINYVNEFGQGFWCFCITPLVEDKFKLSTLASMGHSREEYVYDTFDVALTAAVSMFVLADREQALTEVPFD